MIDCGFKALLQSGHPDPAVRGKIVDLRDKFRDTFAGWWRSKRQRNNPTDASALLSAALVDRLDFRGGCSY
jgi:hypothetical protein